MKNSQRGKKMYAFDFIEVNGKMEKTNHINLIVKAA
jgi:hypothetical protein